METPQVPSPVPPPEAVPQPAGPYPVTPVRNSGMAIASLVLGIFGCCTCITGIIGLILGIVGLNQINSSRGRIGGQGLAIAGIITSAVSIVVCLVLLPALLFPVFAKARAKARETASVNYAKQITTSIEIYVQEHGGKLPPMGNLEELRSSVTGVDATVWTSPYSGDPWATNPSLSGKSDQDIPSPTETVAIYEPTSTSGERVVGFMDGHVVPVSDEEWPSVKAASGIP